MNMIDYTTLVCSYHTIKGHNSP